MNGNLEYSHNLTIRGPSMDGHLAQPPLSKYPWMPELLCHPWTIHGWPPCPASSVKVSVDATVTVPSMDYPWNGPPCPASSVEVSVDATVTVPSIHGPSIDGHLTLPSLLCQSIPSVNVSVDATVTVAIHTPSIWRTNHSQQKLKDLVCLMPFSHPAVCVHVHIEHDLHVV